MSSLSLTYLRDRVAEMLQRSGVPYAPHAVRLESVPYLVRGDETLTRFLACENNRVRFGKFSLDI